MSEFKVFDYPLLIIERHLDTFGHVNNAVYLEIFEEARWDLISKNGYDIRKVTETQQGPTILEVNLKFLKELKLRTHVQVKTQLQSYVGKISILKQWIEGTDGVTFALAEFKIGLFDLRTRKLILPTPEWLQVMGGN